MEGAARYYWFANRFGWTPQQVDAQPVWLTDRLPAVAEIADQIEQDRVKAAQSG